MNYKKRPILKAGTLFLFIFTVINFPLRAGVGVKEQSRGALKAQYAKKAKSESKAVKLVRKELELRYDSLGASYANKDLNGILAVRTTDYIRHGPNGQIGNYAHMVDYYTALIDSMAAPIQFHKTILTVSAKDSEASVLVLQEFSRLQIKAEKLRKVESSAIEHESWVKRGTTWMVKLTDNVQDRRLFVEGKRVDPDKPYNPDDPPFVPDVKRPTR